MKAILLTILTLATGVTTSAAEETNAAYLERVTKQEQTKTLELIESFQSEMLQQKALHSPGHRAVLTLLQNYSEDLTTLLQKSEKASIPSLRSTKLLSEEFVTFLKLSDGVESAFAKWSTDDLFDSIDDRKKQIAATKAKKAAEKAAYWEAERKEYEGSVNFCL